jgi:hypothetical protein
VGRREEQARVAGFLAGKAAGARHGVVLVDPEEAVDLREAPPQAIPVAHHEAAGTRP